ncbi:MAG: hypothetical protein FJX65_09750 [Alphaproteobacteria bacterium]|nr:hypothetical protein [Alphaproteobacteria bacterium]
MPKRNWLILIVVIVAIYTWQRMAQDGPSYSEPDLRTYSGDELEAARRLMIDGLATISTPGACARDHQAFDEATWKPVVDAWGDRNQGLLETVMRVLEDTGAIRDRRRYESDAKAIVVVRLAEWRGGEREACRQFLENVKAGRWDLVNTAGPVLATLEAARLKGER